MKNAGITHICSCIGGEILFPDNFEYLILDFGDRPTVDLLAVVSISKDFLASGSTNGNQVFIYCGSGISRSPSLLLAFLILHREFSFQSAFELMKESRSLIRPNPGFLTQLKNLGERS